MDNNSTPEQVWIPLEAQEGRLATLVKLSGLHGLPNFLEWFNRLLCDNNIPLGHDLESELSQRVTQEHDVYRPATIGELMDWCTNRAELFQSQRLSRITPKALQVVNDRVGLACELNGDTYNLFIPDSIRVVAVIPEAAIGEVALNQLKSTTQDNKDNVLCSCNIVAFICDPLF